MLSNQDWGTKQDRKSKIHLKLIRSYDGLRGSYLLYIHSVVVVIIPLPSIYGQFMVHLLLCNVLLAELSKPPMQNTKGPRS